MNDKPSQTPAPKGDDPLAVAKQIADSSQHAADVTREQIKHIYEKTSPKQPDSTPQQAPDASKQVPTNDARVPTNDSPSTYKRTHKDNFDWRQYHSAWQDYYQEYYRRYYHHLNTKKDLQQSDQPKLQTGDDSHRVEELKQDVVAKVKQQAKNFKRSHHFWPLVSAAIVGFAFLFIQFNSVVFAQVKSYISPGALEGKNLVINDPAGNTAVGPEPRLIIPKINVDIPTNFDVTSLNEAEIQTALQNAAVHYKLPGAEALPGQYGNSVILGHSSNDVFAQGLYKFAFVLTDNLVPGDVFYIHHQGTRYTYKVTEKKVINPHDLAALQVGSDKPMATLVTCTPPGTAINRLLVYGEQISPDPTSATKPSEGDQPSGTEVLPGNAPTLFEQFWGIFF